jgi:hypothetical protein
MHNDIRVIEARLAATQPAGDAKLEMGKAPPVGEAQPEGAH